MDEMAQVMQEMEQRLEVALDNMEYGKIGRAHV